MPAAFYNIANLKKRSLSASRKQGSDAIGFGVCGRADRVERPALSNRAPYSHRVVIACVQLLQRCVERAAIGIRVLGPIAAVSRTTLGRELLVCAMFLVTHGDFLW